MEVKEYTNCPVCKIGIGEMRTIINKQVEAGIMSKRVHPATQVGIHVNIDPTNMPIIGSRLPAIRSFQDICENCGAVFVNRRELGHAVFTGNPAQLFKNFT